MIAFTVIAKDHKPEPGAKKLADGIVFASREDAERFVREDAELYLTCMPFPLEVAEVRLHKPFATIARPHDLYPEYVYVLSDPVEFVTDPLGPPEGWF